MGEVLEDRAFLREQFVQHGFAVVLISAPENMIVGARDYPDRVELDEAQPLDDAPARPGAPWAADRGLGHGARAGGHHDW